MDKWQLCRIQGTPQTVRESSTLIRLRCEGDVTVGRGETANYYLDSCLTQRLISRVHATVSGQRSKSGVTQLTVISHGLNGTFVNDTKMEKDERRVLKEGDRVTFGHQGNATINVGDQAPQPESEFQFILQRAPRVSTTRQHVEVLDLTGDLEDEEVAGPAKAPLPSESSEVVFVAEQGACLPSRVEIKDEGSGLARQSVGEGMEKNNNEVVKQTNIVKPLMRPELQTPTKTINKADLISRMPDGMNSPFASPNQNCKAQQRHIEDIDSIKSKLFANPKIQAPQLVQYNAQYSTQKKLAPSIKAETLSYLNRPSKSIDSYSAMTPQKTGSDIDLPKNKGLGLTTSPAIMPHPSTTPPVDLEFSTQNAIGSNNYQIDTKLTNSIPQQVQTFSAQKNNITPGAKISPLKTFSDPPPVRACVREKSSWQKPGPPAPAFTTPTPASSTTSPHINIRPMSLSGVIPPEPPRLSPMVQVPPNKRARNPSADSPNRKLPIKKRRKAIEPSDTESTPSKKVPSKSHKKGQGKGAKTSQVQAENDPSDAESTPKKKTPSRSQKKGKGAKISQVYAGGDNDPLDEDFSPSKSHKKGQMKGAKTTQAQAGSETKALSAKVKVKLEAGVVPPSESDPSDVDEVNEQGHVYFDEPCSSTKCCNPVGEDVKWVCCDLCDEWYHVACVDVPRQVLDDDTKQYHCLITPVCRSKIKLKIKLNRKKK